MPIAYTKNAKRRERHRQTAKQRGEAARLKLPALIGIVAAAERAIELSETDRATVLRQLTEPQRLMARQSAMERYLSRGEVTRGQYDDGERLLGDWLTSGLDPHITSAYAGRMPSGAPVTPGTGPGSAAYFEAMRGVGPTLSPVLAHVVLFGYAASSWAESIERPATDGIAALRLALDALGLFYRGEKKILQIPL